MPIVTALSHRIFDLILSDLYEVPDDDDEFEEAIV